MTAARDFILQITQTKHNSTPQWIRRSNPVLLKEDVPGYSRPLQLLCIPETYEIIPVRIYERSELLRCPPRDGHCLIFVSCKKWKKYNIYIHGKAQKKLKFGRVVKGRRANKAYMRSNLAEILRILRCRNVKWFSWDFDLFILFCVYVARIFIF